MVCRGKVLLHMSDTVWLDRCQVRVRQPTLAKFVCTFETVSWLMTKTSLMLLLLVTMSNYKFTK